MPPSPQPGPDRGRRGAPGPPSERSPGVSAPAQELSGSQGSEPRGWLVGFCETQPLTVDPRPTTFLGPCPAQSWALEWPGLSLA